MNDDFRIGRGLALGGALLVIVLGSALIVLSACSPKAETPDVPNVPETTGAIDAPEAPKSASQIMRISEIDFASYSRDLASSVGLEFGESMSAATPKIESHFSPQGGSVEDASDSSRKKTETEFSTFGAEGGKVTLVERINIKDDSVKAEQFYAIFKAKGEDFILADYGMKIKCYRGDNTTNWQTSRCP